MQTHEEPPAAGTPSQYLSVLSQAPADQVKALAEALIPSLEPITVLYDRTGLVMLPFTDTAQGDLFYLGEVLIAEARVRVVHEVEGYGACLGHDVEQALALALLDSALTAGIDTEPILSFLAAQAQAQAEADETLLRAVESTCAEMETF
ncbi:MAG TPA: phosphonate C-P lyase system protein PhnG [Aggregatilineales bacterium]|nr:phosphonate C-P lyase system protein PhnG [Aggregatilineales bacterium]